MESQIQYSDEKHIYVVLHEPYGTTCIDVLGEEVECKLLHYLLLDCIFTIVLGCNWGDTLTLGALWMLLLCLSSHLFAPPV